MAQGNIGGSQLTHDVYFTLKDRSAEAKQRLVAACKTYLSDHPGVVFFAAGIRTPDLAREVNDAEFDVALHVAFASREDHDRYQADQRHLQFIEKNRDNWAKVRVFDADV